jgi:hypothetical protein
VAASFQAAPPSIVPGAQTQSGQGVGAAVFPPVGQTPPPSGPVQTPYQQPQAPGPNPYGTPPPSMPSPAYGYPQQPGYQTPPPAAYSPQQGHPTPPPYGISPQRQGPSGGGRNSRPVIIGSVVVSVVAVVGLIAALALNGGDTTDSGNGGGATATSHPPGYRSGDAGRTIEKTECTEPLESNIDPDQVQMPDFTYKHWDSVLECLKAAGWDYETTPVDENTFGEGTVLRQSPKAGTDFDPTNPPEMEFDVSTGNPA